MTGVNRPVNSDRKIEELERRVSALENNRPGPFDLLNFTNATVPATDSGGGLLYVESGALKYKGSSGTITTLGAA